MTSTPAVTNLESKPSKETLNTNDASPVAAPAPNARVWAYSTAEATPLAVACISGSLGAAFTSGLFLAWFCPTALGMYGQFWVYLSLLSVFHMLEFLVTALYNPDKLSVGSFLLANGPEYVAAQATAVVEAYVTQRFAPVMHSSAVFAWLGVAIMLVGQIIRCKAMIDAATNFSHLISLIRTKDHELVTTGMYSLMRHPSYTGYILWAVGSQILLGNCFAAAAFSLVLWKFFSERVQTEDALLRIFFNKQHEEYCKTVWSGIPFVR